ncbi:hypothetical protein FQR65_LT18912 [Abscondita terminalis]|nr:hypothetical protein FQR65_LT18912 [Abscondita terminalis]
MYILCAITRYTNVGCLYRRKQMAQQKVKIKLKGYDHAIVDQSIAKIIQVAEETGAKVRGPIPLPTEKQIITILRATHKRKYQMKGILGRKLEMTQTFTVDGQMVPVTVIEVEPNTVLQVKTVEKDGYSALQLATGEKRENLVNKPDLGNFKKANTAPKRFVKEIRDMNGYEMGNVINISDVFNAGEFVDVTGTSKGKGFAGNIKRYNHARGPMAHGSGYHRGTGSMGSIINKIFKGKKMPGHMGHEKKTVQNLEIIQIDTEKNIVLVKGSVPGPRKSFVLIKQNVKGVASKEVTTLLNRNQKAVVKEEVASAEAAE